MLRLTSSLAFSPVHTRTLVCCCSCCCYSCCSSSLSVLALSVSGERGATGMASSTAVSPSGYVCTHSSSASDVSGSVSPQPAPLCSDRCSLHHTGGEDCTLQSFTRSKRFGVSLVAALILFSAFISTNVDSSWNEVGGVANRVGTPVMRCSGVPGSILLLCTSWVWVLGRRTLFLQTETTPVLIVAGFPIRDTTKCDLSFFESECAITHNYLNVYVPSPLHNPILLETTEPDLYRSRFLIFAYNFLAYGSKTPALGYSPPAAPPRRFTRNMDTIVVPLYGSPYRGYCAMIAIGSVCVQQASWGSV